MGAIKDRMAAGFPGDVSRKTESVIESGVMAETLPYGSVVTLDEDGKFASVTDVEDNIYGFIVRPFPTMASEANAGAINDCLRSGYMTVTLKNGTAKKGLPVYVRIKAASGKGVGDIEASAAVSQQQDGDENAPVTVAENVLIPNCVFMGEADADGNVEISFNV